MFSNNFQTPVGGKGVSVGAPHILLTITLADVRYLRYLLHQFIVIHLSYFKGYFFKIQFNQCRIHEKVPMVKFAATVDSRQSVHFSPSDYQMNRINMKYLP